MSVTPSARVLALAALAPLVWGTTYLVTTELLPPDRPLLTGALRALPAGLVLLALTRTRPRGAWWWRASVLGALNIGAFFGFLFVAAYRLPGGVAATLGAVSPLLVAGLAGAVLGERVRPAARAAAVLGVAGVALLVLTPAARLDAWGILAGLGAAAATAAGVLLTKRWGRPVGLAAFTGWQLVAGGILLAVPALILEGPLPAPSVASVGGYLWLAIPGTALAYLAWFRGILALPASRVMLLSFLAPLTAGALGWLVLGQSLTALQLAGGAAVVGAVALGALPSPAPTGLVVPQPHAARLGEATLALATEGEAVDRASSLPLAPTPPHAASPPASRPTPAIAGTAC